MLLARHASVFGDSGNGGKMETTNLRAVGERVRSLRVQKGMSQEELARRLNLGSRSMISEFESGKRALSSLNVTDYSRFFDVSTDWILFGAGDKEKREYGSEIDELLQAFYSIRNPRARKIAIEQVRALSAL
jgi:transcriptional regulator with XRE-family HTH domain